MNPRGSPAPAQQNWVVEIVDADYAGRANSLALDSGGRPHIAYTAWTNGTQPLNIRYATLSNGSWQRTTLEQSYSGEYGPSIAVDSQDRPWIAYPTRDAPAPLGHWDLRLARWDGSAWQFQTVEPTGVEAGWWPSLALDPQDRPHVAYYSNVTGDLQLAYAEWDRTQWRYATVFRSTDLNLGRLPTWHPIALKLDSLGSPRIAESGNGTLTYFVRNGTQWRAEFPAPVPTGAESVSLALDSRDQPHIAYYDGTATNPKYVHWDGTTWVRETPVWLGTVGWGLSLVLDSGDEPHLSYGHGLVANPPPSYAYYVSKSAGLWGNPETADPTESVAETSLVLDSHELPRISYMRADPISGSELRYASVPWVDTAPPTSHILPISPYWNGNPIMANATDESGVANVTLWYRSSGDNASWGSWIPFGTLANPPWQWSFPYPAGDGYYGFYSTAVDVAGNAEPPPPGTDAVAGYDATPPVSSVAPISPYWHASGALTVDATASDALSGLTSIALWYAYASDNVTWVSWSPFETLTAPPWSWSFSFPDGEGYYRFYAIARDVAGNLEAGKTAAEAAAGYRVPPDYAPAAPSPPSPVTVGLSLPLMLSVEVANLGGTANATATLAFFNASTPGAPFATFPLPRVASRGTAGPFTAPWIYSAVPGTYGIVADVDRGDALAESNETNNAYTWTVNVVPDPITTLVVGRPNVTAGATYVTSATPLSFTVLDQSGTGIRSTRYRLDGGAWIDYVAAFAVAAEGPHLLEWFSEDNAGNVGSIANAILRADDTPPTTTLNVGDPRYVAANTFVMSATPLTLAAMDGGVTPVGVASIEYRIDGGTWAAYLAPPRLAGEGRHTVGYRAADRLLNAEAERTVAIVVDDTPPVTTPSHGDGTYPPGTTFAFAATDAGSGVARTEVRLDGGPWTTYTTPLVLPVGEHTIAYRSTDRVDNREAPREIQVRIEGAPAVAVEANWKLLVAAVFATVLALAGAWSARRAPWPSGTRRRLSAFALVTLPFVLAEIATGVVSVFTGLLAIPPLVGAGTAVDLGILVAGVVVSVYRVRKRKTLT